MPLIEVPSPIPTHQQQHHHHHHYSHQHREMPYRKSSTSLPCLALSFTGFFLCLYLITLKMIILKIEDTTITSSGLSDGKGNPITEKKGLTSPGLNANSIFEAAKAEFSIDHNKIRAGGRDKNVVIEDERQQIKPNPFRVQDKPLSDEKKRPGFIVLGMHRSGTSMLSGLLVVGMKYKVGGWLIGPAYDNAKGFYELVNIVLQNDIFMKEQAIGWNNNIINYDYKMALKHKEMGIVPFDHGRKGLDFLNGKKNIPWLQKDPRMCITLRTWLELIDGEPAIVFTYRDPLEVSKSLVKRKMGVGNIEHGLRLWIVYNMRAIQNSAGLCRVLSSSEALYANPLNEVQRISDELTTKCAVPPPPKRITQEDVDKFVDPSLQHNKHEKAQDNSGARILATHGDCVVYDFKSTLIMDAHGETREKDMYMKAMQIYCDLKSGKAYEEEYEWPTLP